MSFKRFSMVFILIPVFVICVGAKMSYVPVDAQGTGETRKDAIADALQDAVSQVNGAEIAAEMSSSVKEDISEKNGKEEYSTEQAFQENVKKKTKGVVRSWKACSVEYSSFPFFSEMSSLTLLDISAAISAPLT
jgi:ABC-type Na+ efflux pump permease subunit